MGINVWSENLDGEKNWNAARLVLDQILEQDPNVFATDGVRINSCGFGLFMHPTLKQLYAEKEDKSYAAILCMTKCCKMRPTFANAKCALCLSESPDEYGMTPEDDYSLRYGDNSDDFKKQKKNNTVAGLSGDDNISEKEGGVNSSEKEGDGYSEIELDDNSEVECDDYSEEEEEKDEDSFEEEEDSFEEEEDSFEDEEDIFEEEDGFENEEDSSEKEKDYSVDRHETMDADEYDADLFNYDEVSMGNGENDEGKDEHAEVNGVEDCIEDEDELMANEHDARDDVAVSEDDPMEGIFQGEGSQRGSEKIESSSCGSGVQFVEEVLAPGCLGRNALSPPEQEKQDDPVFSAINKQLENFIPPLTQ